MRIFLSWSGELSKAVAKEFAKWLPKILSPVKPWMSQHEIKAGTVWEEELFHNLNNTDSGILLLTKENKYAPWLLFEAGVLSKTANTRKVIPYCIRIPVEEIANPLTKFQGVYADKEGTLQLIDSLNATLPKRINETKIAKLFEQYWPTFEKTLDEVYRKMNNPKPKNVTEVLEVEMKSLNEKIDVLEEYEKNGGGASSQPFWDPFVDRHRQIYSLYKEARKLLEKATQISLSTP